MANASRRGIGYINGVEVRHYTAYQQSQNPSLIAGTIAKDGTVHQVANVAFHNLVIAGRPYRSLAEANIVTTTKNNPREW